MSILQIYLQKSKWKVLKNVFKNENNNFERKKVTFFDIRERMRLLATKIARVGARVPSIRSAASLFLSPLYAIALQEACIQRDCRRSIDLLPLALKLVPPKSSSAFQKAFYQAKISQTNNIQQFRFCRERKRFLLAVNLSKLRIYKLDKLQYISYIQM